MKKISELLTGVFLLIFGGALLSGGVYFLKDKIAFYTHSIQTEGIIIDVESYKSKNKSMYRPLVSYQAADGTIYTLNKHKCCV